MEKLTTTGKAAMAGLVALLTIVANALGGFDAGLRLLVILIFADYITGVAVAIKTKTLDSNVGFKGLFKKTVIFVIVWVAHELDIAIGIDTLRNLTIFFYCSNEGLSLLENTAKLGVPYPTKIKDVLVQLKEDDKDGQKSQKTFTKKEGNK